MSGHEKESLPPELPLTSTKLSDPTMHNFSSENAGSGHSGQLHPSVVASVDIDGGMPLVMRHAAIMTIKPQFTDQEGSVVFPSVTAQMRVTAATGSSGTVTLTLIESADTCSATITTNAPLAARDPVVKVTGTEVNPIRLHRVPGAHLEGVLRRLVPEKSFKRIIEPAIIDERREHIEAVARGDVNQARLISVRLWVIVIGNLIMSLSGWWDRFKRSGA